MTRLRCNLQSFNNSNDEFLADRVMEEDEKNVIVVNNDAEFLSLHDLKKIVENRWNEISAHTVRKSLHSQRRL